MPLPSTSIKRPVTVAMFYIAVALLGIYAFSRIGVDLLQDINFTQILVQNTYLVEIKIFSQNSKMAVSAIDI